MSLDLTQNGYAQAYLPEIEANHPGALASQWIPMEPKLWRVENYRDFLAARQELLAAETNKRMADLLHGDTRWLEGTIKPSEALRPVMAMEGITGAAEEEALVSLNDWVEAQGLPRGQMSFDYTDPDTGEQRAVFDLAWPDGVQEGLSQPVAVLLNEGEETLALASSAGFRCFTDIACFKAYLMKEVLGEVLTP